MTVALSPKERIESFIADWHQCRENARQNKNFDTTNGGHGLGHDTLRQIEAECAQIALGLSQRHFIEGKSCGPFSYLGTGPKGSERDEEVLAIVEEGTSARVEVRGEKYGRPHYKEYRLVLRDGDWKIAGLLSSLNAPDKPLLTEKQRNDLLARARPDAALGPLDEEQVSAEGLGRSFRAGRRVQKGDDVVTTTIRRLGELQLTSGLLGVSDLGEITAFDLDTLARSVPPGSYPVEILLAQEYILAVRLLLDPNAQVADWHLAEVSQGGHEVGVNAGNVAIFDLSSVVTLKARTVDHIYDQHVLQVTERPNAHLFSLAQHEGADPAILDAVVVDSGNGDGSYPMHWGVNAEGKPVVLMITFIFPPDVDER
ncbi:MAG: DUF4241 domain-containing protein [Polyangiaceae bacterium]|nr:DUF4241 domain-containing protein [Polyangiaceae bacterium]